ncbi:MAG: UDP-N-acetylglucosamine diphosphorylase/glucosamine-1-phosphate N-acetyltransferase [Thiothrix sp.]|nr:MAG: UDP-N-acetylglucosamine diphosphorylase/glucosamine-1-phosphate N-acetyltransferase [Thiothrix sp.]
MTISKSLAVVILAAGQGTRMRSSKPKVLHELAGRPLLQHVIDVALELNPEEIVVVIGHGAEQVRDTISNKKLRWVVQEEQLGTGHAVRIALPEIEADNVLVLYGDVPLITSKTLQPVIKGIKRSSIHLLTVDLEDPTGYGRIVRDNNGEVQKIVEHKDASEEILQLTEGNTGILCAARLDLMDLLTKIRSDNSQGEYYLTDCIELCIAEQGRVNGIKAEYVWQVSGINDKPQLNKLERRFQLNKAQKIMENGVTLADKNRFDVRGELKVGEDVYIDINCIFSGNVQLGDNVSIGPNCCISNASIGNGVEVFANTVIEDAMIEADCSLGPFARIRPQTIMRTGSKAGNFVEIKKSEIGEGSKVNHLSYIGDAKLGKTVNVGAGTITCNYDGANKHITEVGDNVFIGSNSAIVAPVVLEEGATIGAGSTITKRAPKEKLTLERSRQITLENWRRATKGEK